MNPQIEIPPQFTRFERSAIAELFQYKDGGKYGVGMIEGVSVITRGEALGHYAWIDEKFLEQVAAAINDSENGIKARFTHPSMSSDGLGKLLGRVTDARVEGNKVVGDLHFATSATKSPDGDLVEYVRLLIDEDSDAAGLSIVFEHDMESEDEFHLENGAVKIEDSMYSPYEIDMSGFESPDEMNEDNLPHVRLGKLRAADLVDEPAANPDGIYSLQTLPNDADSFLKFVVGENVQKPNALFGVDADRASEFFQRWLRSNDYVLMKGETMVSENEATESVENDSVEVSPVEATTDEAVSVQSEPESFSKTDFVNQLKKYTESFGAVNGQEWFENGVSMIEAFEKHSNILKDENESLRSEIGKLQSALKSIEFGESEGLGIGASDESIVKPMTFAQFTQSQKN